MVSQKKRYPQIIRYYIMGFSIITIHLGTLQWVCLAGQPRSLVALPSDPRILSQGAVHVGHGRGHGQGTRIDSARKMEQFEAWNLQSENHVHMIFFFWKQDLSVSLFGGCHIWFRLHKSGQRWQNHRKLAIWVGGCMDGYQSLLLVFVDGRDFNAWNLTVINLPHVLGECLQGGQFALKWATKEMDDCRLPCLWRKKTRCWLSTSNKKKKCVNFQISLLEECPAYYIPWF